MPSHTCKAASHSAFLRQEINHEPGVPATAPRSDRLPPVFSPGVIGNEADVGILWALHRQRQADGPRHAGREPSRALCGVTFRALTVPPARAPPLTWARSFDIHLSSSQSERPASTIGPELSAVFSARSPLHNDLHRRHSLLSHRNRVSAKRRTRSRCPYSNLSVACLAISAPWSQVKDR